MHDEATPPRVLVASTFTWTTAGRLAVAFDDAGFVVDAVAPVRSILHRIGAVRDAYRLGVTRPLADLRRAIEASSPDLVVPADDPTRQALHRVHEAADSSSAAGAAVRAVLERSLGRPDAYPLVYSRRALMTLAADLGHRVPTSADAATGAAALAWKASHVGPAVMKTDGSWGGRGVEVVVDESDVAAAWRRFSRPPRWHRIAKRLVVDCEPWPLRDRLAGRRGEVSIQSYVVGRPGTVAVACLSGEVLAATASEVLVTTRPTGPSTVLRVVDGGEMTDTVIDVVRQLGLSGLCGFDFLIEAETGHPYLLELNPRATPTSHLITADGVDPLATLGSALRGRPPPPRRDPYPGGMVALFPQEIERDLASPYLVSGHHDVPTHAEDFVSFVTPRAAQVDASDTARPLRRDRSMEGIA
jgi:hypothetical protein